MVHSAMDTGLSTTRVYGPLRGPTSIFTENPLVDLEHPPGEAPVPFCCSHTSPVPFRPSLALPAAT